MEIYIWNFGEKFLLEVFFRVIIECLEVEIKEVI